MSLKKVLREDINYEEERDQSCQNTRQCRASRVLVFIAQGAVTEAQSVALKNNSYDKLIQKLFNLQLQDDSQILIQHCCNLKKAIYYATCSYRDPKKIG